MRLLRFLTLALISTAIMAGCESDRVSTGGGNSGAPDDMPLRLDENNFDFGFAPQNSLVSHTFWLFSTGTEALEIDSVVPDCGCTNVPLDRNIIPPGDSVALRVLFATNDYETRISLRTQVHYRTSEGAASKQVQIVCTVSENPDSQWPLLIKPYRIEWNSLPNREQNFESFSITNVSERDAILRLIDYRSDLFEISLPTRVQSDDSRVGTLSLHRTPFSGSVISSITIEVENGSRSRITIPITGFVNQE